MHMREPTCYLSFPVDAGSAAAAGRLRSSLESRGITVLPPSDDGSQSMSSSPFYWLRMADVVVVDMTGDSTWVAFEAGAAKALNKTLIPVAQPSAEPSAIRRQLPRILEYDPDQIAALADYVQNEVARSLSNKS
jgi:hypothetical protein